MDEVLGPPPVRRGPRPEPRLVADGVPRQGANEVVPGVGVAGPRARLVWKEGVPVARLVPLAGCHAGSEDRQVHAVKAVRELVEEVPVHPLRQPEGKEARFPQAGWPLVRRSQAGDGPRRVIQPGEPCPPGIVQLRAFPQDVDFVLVRRAAVGARGVGPRAVARHAGRCPHGPGHEAAQQRLLQLRGGYPQRRAASRAIRPVAQPTKGDRAPRLKLAQGVAAKAVPDPVLEVAEWLLHEVPGVFLPWDVPAPPALARGPAQGGRRAERAPHRARPGWAAPQFPDSLGEDMGDPRPPGQPGQPEEALISRVHDWGHAMPLGKDGEDDLLGPGHARCSPQGPHYYGL